MYVRMCVHAYMPIYCVQNAKLLSDIDPKEHFPVKRNYFTSSACLDLCVCAHVRACMYVLYICRHGLFISIKPYQLCY